MKRKLKIPAKRAPMPEGYDGVKTKKQQGSPALQGVGGVSQRRIESRIGEEAFEEWDDFIIWESYESARSYLRNVEARLKGLKA